MHRQALTVALFAREHQRRRLHDAQAYRLRRHLRSGRRSP
jgi:hypothetical protein